MYSYENEKHKIFTEDGMLEFLKVRDAVLGVLKTSGAITMDKAMNLTHVSNSWYSMALVDHMEVVGDIVEVTRGEDVCGQHRIFRKVY